MSASTLSSVRLIKYLRSSPSWRKSSSFSRSLTTQPQTQPSNIEQEQNAIYSMYKPRPISYNLQDKVAIVTGSTDGIGYEIAKRIAQSGGKVVVCSRKQENVNQAVEKIRQEANTDPRRIEGTVCHVGQEQQRKELLEYTLDKFGGVDIFVANAAVNPAKGHMLQTDESEFRKILEVNLVASFSMTKALVPHMIERKGGSVVYISSVAGYQVTHGARLTPSMAAYSVSKAAIFGLTRAMADDCAQHNIRVNCVAPGLINTAFSKRIVNGPSYPDYFNDLQLIKRMGESEECAGAVAFLASDDASYITGETLVVAGGMFSRL